MNIPNTLYYASFEAFTVLMLQIEVFWLVVGYKRYSGLLRPHGPLKLWYSTTTLHGVTIQKTWT